MYSDPKNEEKRHTQKIAMKLKSVEKRYRIYYNKCFFSRLS